MPATVGMMAGLTYLQLFGYFLHITHRDEPELGVDPMSGENVMSIADEDSLRFDVFHHLARMEWVNPPGFLGGSNL